MNSISRWGWGKPSGGVTYELALEEWAEIEQKARKGVWAREGTQ